MKREDDPIGGVSSNIGYLLSSVAELAQREYDKLLTTHGLSAQHVGVLHKLHTQPGIVQSRIGEDVGIFKPVVVSLLNDLEEQGWVERRPHFKDRRANQVFLTNVGQTFTEDLIQESKRVLDDFLMVLSSNERDQLRTTLQKLLSSHRPKTGEENS